MTDKSKSDFQNPVFTRDEIVRMTTEELQKLQELHRNSIGAFEYSERSESDVKEVDEEVAFAVGSPEFLKRT